MKSNKPRGQRARQGLTKTERIRHVVKLMAGGQWVTGVTGAELAEQWEISQTTMDADAAEASRVVRSAIADADDIRARIVATLETIISTSMGTKQLRTAVEAVRTLAGVTGAEAPKKLDVATNLGDLLSLGLGSGGEGPTGAVGE